jgi:hypothetical protein
MALLSFQLLFHGFDCSNQQAVAQQDFGSATGQRREMTQKYIAFSTADFKLTGGTSSGLEPLTRFGLIRGSAR